MGKQGLCGRSWEAGRPVGGRGVCSMGIDKKLMVSSAGKQGTHLTNIGRKGSGGVDVHSSAVFCF